MRSLTAKLTFAFLIISVLGTAMVALLLNWQTRRQFDALVSRLYEDDLVALHSQLTAYYQEQSSWDGAESVIVGERRPDAAEGPQPPTRRLPITLVDGSRRVVIGDRRYPQAEPLQADLVEDGLPIEVDGETAGWLLLDSFGGPGGDFADSPEANFLANVNRITVLSALGTAVVGVLLGVFLARTISHPVSELKAATRKVALGELGAQVPIRSADEIGELAVSFNQMSADLARSVEVRRLMTADIAHDLRTPLSVIQGYTEALDDGKLSGSAEIYGAIHRQVKHLNRLVEDLRTLSLADAGQLSLHPQEFKVRDLLEHVALAYAPQAEQQQVTLHVDASDALPPVAVDPDRMVQVLGNLISNALRHTAPGGEVRLSAENQGRSVTIKVQDTGAGIAPEDLPHVFDRFYRGDKARSESGVSGLGLAIARSLVEAQNGAISVDSVRGQGATFRVTLPAA